ncbi:MAG: hypothetical protein F4094_04590 [Synechococcus sp. SB0672_bin_6]|nr:hypothetical protein [Synechococcus sp. SB0672_bin_6]
MFHLSPQQFVTSPPPHAKALIGLCLGVVLTACGGGGSGGPTATTSTHQPLPPSNQRLNTNQALANSDVTPEDLEWQETQFGSVFVAGSQGFASVNDVSTTFDGMDLDITISRFDGSRIFFDGSKRIVYGIDLNDFSYDLDDEALWIGYSYFQDASMNISETANSGRIQAASYRVQYDPENSADYVSFGYWLDWKLTTINLIEGLEMGLFADGPDFESAANLPLTGQATYSGDFFGEFMHANTSETVVQMGQYEADLEMTANFGNDTISGCIGCNYRNINTLSVISSARVSEYTDQPTAYYARLNPTTLSNNGQYRGNITVRNVTGLSVNTLDGEYAGKMSTLNGDDTNSPVETVGTAYAVWRDSNGTGLVGGAFLGANDNE